MKQGEPLTTEQIRAILSGISSAMVLPTSAIKPIYRQRKEKRCARCGKLHTHNNLYCSAMCCRLHIKEAKP